MPFRFDWLNPIVGRRDIKPHPLLRRNSARFSGEPGEKSIKPHTPEDIRFHKESAEAKAAGNLPPKPPKEHQPVP